LSAQADGLFIIYRTYNPAWGGNEDIYLFVFKQAGSYAYSPFPIESQASVSLITPLSSFVFPSNPIYFSGIIANGQNYDKLDFYINYDTLGWLLNIASSTFVLPNYTTSWSRQLNLPYIGVYTAKVRLVNSTTGATTTYSNAVTFTLSSTTESINTNISSTTLVVPQTSYKTCESWLDFGCIMFNGLIGLFSPSTESVQQFVGYKAQVENKPPFGYIAILITNLGNLSTTSSSTFAITIPSAINTYILSPLKVGLGAILWFVALIWLYNRLKHIQL
jgi:hypothetical protein